MEIDQIKGASYFRTLLLSFVVFHSRIALFFSIFTYVFLGNYISAQKVKRTVFNLNPYVEHVYVRLGIRYNGVLQFVERDHG